MLYNFHVFIEANDVTNIEYFTLSSKTPCISLFIVQLLNKIFFTIGSLIFLKFN